MRKKDFEALVQECIDEAIHKLENDEILKWEFQLSDKLPPRVLGSTNIVENTIFISRPFANHGRFGDVKDTILHEIAHVYTKEDHNHGEKWKRVAEILGACPSAGKFSSVFDFMLISWREKLFFVGILLVASIAITIFDRFAGLR